MSDNTAWVTGASGYWGRKVILSLLRQGWKVVALCRTQPTDLCDWATAQNHSLTWRYLDWEAPDTLQTLTHLPVPQAFFHCSGLYDDDLPRMLAVNVIQPIRLMEALIPRMEAQGGGRIGVLLGQNGRLGLPGLGAFSATQGALWTWAEAMARTLRDEKRSVSLTLVFPHRAPSELQRQLAKQLQKKVKLKPPGTANQLVKDVLKSKPRAGRRPLAAGLMTLFT